MKIDNSTYRINNSSLLPRLGEVGRGPKKGNRPSGNIDPNGMWTDAAYRSDLRGYNAYRLSKYRTYMGYNRANNVYGEDPAKILNLIDLTGGGGYSIDGAAERSMSNGRRQNAIEKIEKQQEESKSETEKLEELQDVDNTHAENSKDPSPEPIPSLPEGDGDDDDYRVNLLKSDNIIKDIFIAIHKAAANESFNNLFDVIIPNGYGSGYYQSLIKRVTINGNDFKILIAGYTDALPRSHYDIDENGFGYLDRFSEYPKDNRHNGGYYMGYFMTNEKGNYLILFGAKTSDGFEYLRTLYHRYD